MVRTEGYSHYLKSVFLQIIETAFLLTNKKTAMLNKEHGGNKEPLVAFKLSKWVVFAWYSKGVLTIRSWKR